MQQLRTLIEGRRSIRKYLERMVSEDDLQQVLEAVRWAPSWANTQCWEVVVVRDPQVRERLQEAVAVTKNPALKAVGQAPVVLVMCAKTDVSGFYKGKASTHFGDWMMYDLGLATQNLCLTAHDLGLGTVIVGIFDHAAVTRILGIPQGFVPVTLIPLGYPAKIGGAPDRKQVLDFIHTDRW